MEPVGLDLECREVLREMRVPLDAIQYGRTAPDDRGDVVLTVWVPLLSRPLTITICPVDPSWVVDRREYLRVRIREALQRSLRSPRQEPEPAHTGRR